MDHKVANIARITSFVIMLMRKKAVQFPGERGGWGEGGTIPVELACSPYVSVGFLQEFQFLPTSPKCAG